jgi:hypothetical protein
MRRRSGMTQNLIDHAGEQQGAEIFSARFDSQIEIGH